jgi:hypothetical protein
MSALGLQYPIAVASIALAALASAACAFNPSGAPLDAGGSDGAAPDFDSSGPREGGAPPDAERSEASALDGEAGDGATPDAPSSDGAGGGDAADGGRPDGAISDGGGCAPWPATNIDPCDPMIPPPSAVSLSGLFRYDTRTSTIENTIDHTVLTISSTIVEQKQVGMEIITARVIHATDFSLTPASQLLVDGPYPLIILAEGGAFIDGEIDLFDGSDIDCAAAVMLDGRVGHTTGGGGGGGGGGFGDKGGNGGDGHGTMHGAGGAGMGASGAPDLRPLRGGCSGGLGGDDVAMTTIPGGSSGRGGGALQISARVEVRVMGEIHANGMGGQAGTAPISAEGASGGGGGGSGGAILLESSTVAVAGRLCANGGSGGEGGAAGTLLPPSSADGRNGPCALAAAFTDDSTAGGNGGDGGYGAAAMLKGLNGGNGLAPSATTFQASGGGGGGGSAGRIRVRAIAHLDLMGADVVSPEPDTM